MNHYLRIAAFTVSTVLISASAIAGPIEDRQDKMKTVGKSIGVVAKMAKGETDFEGNVALQAYVDMKNASEGFGDLFPDGSGEGKTEAAPAIFTDRAGFEAEISKFQTTLSAVTESAPADLAALQASLKQVGASCGSCHKGYRVKKN